MKCVLSLVSRGQTCKYSYCSNYHRVVAFIVGKNHQYFSEMSIFVIITVNLSSFIRFLTANLCCSFLSPVATFQVHCLQGFPWKKHIALNMLKLSMLIKVKHSHLGNLDETQVWQSADLSVYSHTYSIISQRK